MVVVPPEDVRAVRCRVRPSASIVAVSTTVFRRAFVVATFHLPASGVTAVFNHPMSKPSTPASLISPAKVDLDSEPEDQSPLV